MFHLKPSDGERYNLFSAGAQALFPDFFPNASATADAGPAHALSPEEQRAAEQKEGRELEAMDAPEDEVGVSWYTPFLCVILFYVYSSCLLGGVLTVVLGAHFAAEVAWGPWGDFELETEKGRSLREIARRHPSGGQFWDCIWGAKMS